MRKRGPRKVFFLSPLLYILMVDSSSQRLEKKRISINLQRICIIRGAKETNHSHFSNDTLLMIGEMSNDRRNIQNGSRSIYKCFIR
jgi:hypothetical protein